MSFFSKFGLAEFKFNNKTWIIEDLTKHVNNFPDMFFNNVTLDSYQVKQGDRPDNVASSLYDNVNYWWTLLLVNNISVNDWPLDEKELDEWIDLNYSKYEQNSVVRYEDDDGVEVPAYGWYSFSVDGEDQFYHYNRGDDFLAVNSDCNVAKSRHNPITLRMSLEKENENKKNIKVIKPTRILQFVKDFEKRIKGKVSV